ncbi:MAG TPA: 3-dehydroquinate synthase [Pyrinomonadaceae bacterium]|nr:3-dehydroquinate synthase [Pyrinomonadaceae bacterium]
MQRQVISLRQESRQSEINIGYGIRRNLRKLVLRTFGKFPGKLILISNKRVFRLYGLEVMADLKTADTKVFPWLIPDGERYKSFRTFASAVNTFAEIGLERSDLVIALGGGVVGDLAGFAASTYLRGIRLLQMPTTLLAQIDSSIGGKTAINLTAGKNLVGTFYQPDAVCIDTQTLGSLPARELVSGFCEMVKQSLVASPELFEQTVDLLRRFHLDQAIIATPEFERLINAHCMFKASIVVNDERESTERTDSRSRRILNFGHTTAHALEKVTNYRYFRHGEAVGYGMLVAGELSKHLGLLSSDKLAQLREAVNLCGRLPSAGKLDVTQIKAALKLDKKSVRGQINWVLLDDIGSPRIVEGRAISNKVLGLSLFEGLGISRRRIERSH